MTESYRRLEAQVLSQREIAKEKNGGHRPVKLQSSERSAVGSDRSLQGKHIIYRDLINSRGSAMQSHGEVVLNQTPVMKPATNS